MPYFYHITQVIHILRTRDLISTPRIESIYTIIYYNIIYEVFTRVSKLDIWRREGGEVRRVSDSHILYVGMRDYYHNYVAAYPFKSKILVVVFRFPYFIKKNSAVIFPCNEWKHRSIIFLFFFNRSICSITIYIYIYIGNAQRGIVRNTLKYSFSIAVRPLID